MTQSGPNSQIAMPVVVCPGFHNARLTAQFVRSLPPFVRPLVVDAFCANPLAVFDWMTQTLGAGDRKAPVVAIGFSGGVVGLSGALTIWQQQGGKVAQLIAIDGWGMPIVGLPVCRLSHDSFTHWSSLPLGAGDVNFYAEPAVDHLAMWESPAAVIGQSASGWQAGGTRMSAADFVAERLAQVRTAF